MRSPLIFCIESSASADGHSIGFRTLSEDLESDGENILFLPPTANMRQELVNQVLKDISQRERDSGIKGNTRNREHLRGVLPLEENATTYIQLKARALEIMKSLG